MGNQSSEENKPNEKDKKPNRDDGKKEFEQKPIIEVNEGDVLKRFNTDFPEYSYKNTCMENGEVPKDRIEDIVRFSREFEKKVLDGDVLNDFDKTKKDELITLLSTTNPENVSRNPSPILEVAKFLRSVDSPTAYQTSLQFYTVGLKCIKEKYLYAIYLGSIGLIWEKLGELERSMVFLQKSVELIRELGEEEPVKLKEMDEIDPEEYRDKQDLCKALIYKRKVLSEFMNELQNREEVGRKK